MMYLPRLFQLNKTNKCHQIEKMYTDVPQGTKLSMFDELFEHFRRFHTLDENMRDELLTNLIRLVVNGYLNLYSHQCGRIHTERVIKVNKASRWHELTKQILMFHHE